MKRTLWKCSDRQTISRCSQGLHGCTDVALAYDNEALTGHPDEMDFLSVDTSDCVVTVGLRECGLIVYKDLCSVDWY